LLAAWIAILNVTQFFTRQMQDPTVWESFSTRETVPMRAALGRNYEAILGSTTIAPSVESALLPPNQRDSIRAFDVATDLPYRGSGPALIVLETEHDAAIVDEVMRYYPDAQRVPIVAPNGVKPLVEEIVLERDVLAAHHGLAAIGDSAWKTLLALDTPGTYGLTAPAGMQLTVDGSFPVSSGQFDLARGNHLVELHGAPEDGEPLELRWQPPGASQTQAVDPRALFLPPEGGTGLAVTFFPAQSFDGEPKEKSIDPLIAHYFHTNPFARLNLDAHNSWSAEWRGLLQVPAAGTYRFEADRLSRAGVWIDDQLVFDDTADRAPTSTSGTAELQAGEHTIRVRFQDRADGGPRVYLYWTPPGGNRQVLPGAVLLPPRPTAQ
jgi:hypothetical protein